MLSWLPEKTFQRFAHFAVPALADPAHGVGAGAAPGGQPGLESGRLAGAGLSGGLFLLSAAPFLGYVLSNDPPAAWAALRCCCCAAALATGFGLLAGFLYPPARAAAQGPRPVGAQRQTRCWTWPLSLVGLVVSIAGWSCWRRWPSASTRRVRSSLSRCGWAKTGVPSACTNCARWWRTPKLAWRRCRGRMGCTNRSARFPATRA